MGKGARSSPGTEGLGAVRVEAGCTCAWSPGEGGVALSGMGGGCHWADGGYDPKTSVSGCGPMPRS